MSIRRWVWVCGWVVAVAAMGCEGEKSPPPAVQPERLVRVEEEPRGMNCAWGGTAIRTGHDVDGDGLLGDQEVSETRYACQQPGQQSRLVPEPAGLHCLHGGMALWMGPDANGNGVLDEAEVTTTEYLCHEGQPSVLLRIEVEAPGVHCAAGGRRILSGRDQDGDGVLGDAEVEQRQYVCEVRELVRVEAEQAGVHCPGGGAAVRKGTDTNGDGVLQDFEVSQTEYVCDRVIQGDVIVEVPSQLLALADVKVITGALHIGFMPELTQVALPALAYLGGDLTLNVLSEVRTLSFPALRQVGGALWISSNPKLDQLELGSLQEVHQDLALLDNGELKHLRLPSLQSLGGGLYVTGHFNLEVLELPLLQRTTGINLSELKTEAIDLPVLSETGEVRISDTPVKTLRCPALARVQDSVVLAKLASLEQLALPVLRTVGGNLLLRDTAALTSFALPKLEEVSGDFNLWSNVGLLAVDAPLLTRIGGQVLWVNNSALATLSGLSQVASVGADMEFTGNHALKRFEWPSLRRAGEILIGRTGSNNAQIEAVSLPQLEWAEALTLIENTALRALHLPVGVLLTDQLLIDTSPLLPRCQVENLLEQLRLQPLNVVLFGLDERPLCD